MVLPKVEKHNSKVSSIKEKESIYY